ncbi:MAG: rod-binding protein [Mangrovicoccus sp.]|nr:rod-binding protein [Mangrovicoccus sp.]
MQVTPHIPAITVESRSASDPDAALRRAAEKLESTFLSEMLRSAGLGETAETFGGGVGEDQFASFLSDAQAETIVTGGGIGLAESIFRSLKARG